MFWVNKIIWFFADPYVLTLAGLIAYASISRRSAWLWAGILWLWIWSCGIGTYWLDRQMIADYPPMRAEEYPSANAIVDLGGGMGRKVNSTGYAEINSSADRVWMSARLWKAGKAPIIIPSGIGCSETDGQLLGDLGVPREVIDAENDARNTEENAKYVSMKLASIDKPSILLVTSVWHMKRSMLMFSKYAPDVTVIPVATDYEGRDDMQFTWRRLLPSAAGIYSNICAAHELAGYWWYKWAR